MDISRYTKFFNYGYFLSQFEPGFLKKLLSAVEGTDDIKEPLQAGKSQYGKEIVLFKLKGFSKDPLKDKAPEKGIEPEI